MKFLHRLHRVRIFQAPQAILPGVLGHLVHEAGHGLAGIFCVAKSAWSVSCSSLKTENILWLQS
jgi:hypothetical protein